MDLSELILALFAPLIMTVFFTRVTYNHYVSSLLTLIVIVGIVTGYKEPTYVVIFWGLSLALGFYVSRKMEKKLKRVKTT